MGAGHVKLDNVNKKAPNFALVLQYQLHNIRVLSKGRGANQFGLDEKGTGILAYPLH